MRVSLILTLSLLASAPAFAQQSLLDILQKSYNKAKSAGKVEKQQEQKQEIKEEAAPQVAAEAVVENEPADSEEIAKERIAPLEKIEPISLKAEIAPMAVDVEAAITVREEEPKYFPVSKNENLLAYFDESFAYRFKGKKRFKYRLENVHYYQLDFQKDVLVAYNSDYSLDGFNNFAVIRMFEDGSFEELVHYNSQEAREDFSMEVISEALCNMNQDCAALNEKRKEEEKSLRASISNWEETNLNKIKERLVQALATELKDNSKINMLSESFKAEKVKQYRKILNSAEIRPGEGMESLSDAVSKAWKDELYEEDFTALFAKLKTLSPEEQNVELAKRGLYSTATWMIRKNYENFMIESVHEDCRNFDEARVHESYCEQFTDWDESYRVNTSRAEVYLMGGRIKF